MDYRFNPRHNRKKAVTAPTSRGIVLFRTLIDDERHLAEIDAARRHADCTPYKAD